jgi:DnaJ-class molecular chaperone
MLVTKEFYVVLDIPAGTDQKGIEEAYQYLAHSQDPSVVDRFEEINLAYSILSNKQTRFFYNFYYAEARGLLHRNDGTHTVKLEKTVPSY